MVEWIALVLSVIALLLEREKISKFFQIFLTGNLEKDMSVKENFL